MFFIFKSKIIINYLDQCDISTAVANLYCIYTIFKKNKLLYVNIEYNLFYLNCSNIYIF